MERETDSHSQEHQVGAEGEHGVGAVRNPRKQQ